MRYKSIIELDEENNWQGIIQLVAKKFLLLFEIYNEDSSSITIAFFHECMTTTHKLGYVEVDKINLSDCLELFSTLEYWILTHLILPDRCRLAYLMCRAFTEYNDAIFLTRRELVRDTYNYGKDTQCYRINLTSIYQLEYSRRDLTIRSTNKNLPGMWYGLNEDPEILTRKIIFNLYENGYEDISCVSL